MLETDWFGDDDLLRIEEVVLVGFAPIIRTSCPDFVVINRVYMLLVAVLLLPLESFGVSFICNSRLKLNFFYLCQNLKPKLIFLVRD